MMLTSNPYISHFLPGDWDKPIRECVAGSFTENGQVIYFVDLPINVVLANGVVLENEFVRCEWNGIDKLTPVKAEYARLFRKAIREHFPDAPDEIKRAVGLL